MIGPDRPNGSKTYVLVLVLPDNRVKSCPTCCGSGLTCPGLILPRTGSGPVRTTGPLGLCAPLAKIVFFLREG